MEMYIKNVHAWNDESVNDTITDNYSIVFFNYIK